MDKYFLKNKQENESLIYTFYDVNGTAIYNRLKTTCYYSVTQTPIYNNHHSVISHFHIDETPYSEESVIRWINELNEIGFPCHYKGINKDCYDIEVLISEMQDNKIIFNTTLMLIRCLKERRINMIPALYLSSLDENPDQDKFILMQESHKHKKLRDTAYLNTNHVIISPQSTANPFTKEQFLKRLKQEPVPLSNYHVSIIGFWNSSR